MKLLDEEFLVLNQVDLRYVVDVRALSKVVGVKPERIEEILSRLERLGYLRQEEGGWTLTEKSREIVRAHRRKLLKKLGEEGRKSLRKLNKRMEDAGFYLKYTVARHQLGADGPLRILESMEEVHRELTAVINELSRLLPYFRIYLPRLEHALLKIKEGDYLYIDWHPDSYHFVYFELHADLLSYLREDEE